MQLIPELAKKAADLTVYQRTPIWVVPKFDVRFSERGQAAVRPDSADPAGDPRGDRRDLRVLITVAVLHYRQLPFRRLNIVGDRPARRCHRSCSIRDKELRRRLTPDYDFGCKRPTFSNSYYRTFTKPHVHLQDRGIDRIEPDGIVANDGTKTVIDTLVLATGFDLWEANFPAIEIDRAQRPQPRKVVARNPVPGLPGRVDAILPELISAWPVRTRSSG